MKKIFYAIILLSFSALSQTIEPYKATGKQMFSVETEFFYSQENDDRVKLKNWNLFNGLLRYGVTNNLELNIAVSNTKENSYQNHQLINEHHRFDYIKMGFLHNISINLKNTEMALQLDLISSLDQDHENANKMGVVTSVNFGTALSQNFLLSYNVGFLKDVDASDNLFYKVNLQYSISDYWVLFTENTGNKHQDFDWTHSVGIGYYKNSWAVESVIGKGYSAPDFFTGCKLIKEFNFKRKAIN